MHLMNNLQLGLVPKINHSMQNWHQQDNLPYFIQAMHNYCMNFVDLLKVNNL